jgi:hypothetical protein
MLRSVLASQAVEQKEEWSMSKAKWDQHQLPVQGQDGEDTLSSTKK